MIRKFLGGTALVTAVLGPLSAAQAQDSGVQLSEIVVTAQKRSENLQVVPITVAAFSGAQLQNAAVSNAQDLNSVTPSVNVISALGFVKPFVRGVGSLGNGAGIEAPVSVYVDGVYLTSTPSAFFTFSDVERVEILKGPQGTLFGRNATGGMIHIITKDPSATPTGKVEAGYGNYNSWSLNGYLAGPLSDTLRGSLAAQYSTQGDGFGKNTFTGAKANFVDHDLSGRGKLVWRPTDATTVKVSADYTDRDAPLFDWRAVPGLPIAFVTPPSQYPWDVNNDAKTYTAFKGGGASLRIDHALGWADLMSLTAYRKSEFHYGGDNDATPLPLSFVDSTLKEDQFTQEVQIQSPAASSIKWVAGAFYLKASGKVDPQRVAFGGARAFLGDRRTFADIGTDSISGFGQTTFSVLSPQTHLTLGARYTRETRDDSYTVLIRLPGGPLNTTAAGSQEKTFAKWTWRLSLDHNLTEDVLLYVSYNRGFKSGGYTQSFPADKAFNPEVIDAYEAGVKSELLDHRLRLNAAAFYYDYSNLQVSYSRDGALGLNNGAAAELYGVDVEFEGVVTDWLTVNGGAGFLHGEFTEFPTGVRATVNPAGGFGQAVNQNLGGKTTPSSPELTLNLAADVHWQTASGKWGAVVNYYYNDGYFSEADNVLKQPAYSLVSATARWTSPDDHYSVKLWGKNLTDEAVVTQLIAGTTNPLATYQPPRTFGITASASF